jgi:hypothetical protein
MLPVAAFTVKHEMATFLETSVRVDNLPDYQIVRMKDGAGFGQVQELGDALLFVVDVKNGIKQHVFL